MRRPFFRLPLALAAGVILAYAAVSAASVSDVGWDRAAIRRDALVPRLMLTGVTCAAAGAARLLLVHPRSATRYGRWLATTPWHPGLPLPMGPVRLAWEDLTFLLPVSAVAVLDGHLPPTLVPVAFAVGYAAAALAVAPDSDRMAVRWVGLGVALAWAGAVRCHGSTAAVAGAAAAVLLLADMAVRRGLARFPTEPFAPAVEPNRPAGPIWPYARLGPAKPPAAIGLAVGLAAAVVAAAWASALVGLLPVPTQPWPSDDPLVGQAVVLVVGGAIWRTAIYCGFYASPINPLGRLVTRRLLIPGYDRVFVAPALMVAAAVTLPPAMRHAGASPGGVVAAVVGVGLAVGLVAGPTRRQWQLTGHHRIRAGFRPNESRTARSRR